MPFMNSTTGGDLSCALMRSMTSMCLPLGASACDRQIRALPYRRAARARDAAQGDTAHCSSGLIRRQRAISTTRAHAPVQQLPAIRATQTLMHGTRCEDTDIEVGIRRPRNPPRKALNYGDASPILQTASQRPRPEAENPEGRRTLHALAGVSGEPIECGSWCDHARFVIAIVLTLLVAPTGFSN